MPALREPKATAAAAVRHGDRRGYRRVVVKAGTTLLTREDGDLNGDVMADLVDQIGRLHSGGAEMVLVTSGAVAAGRHLLRSFRRGRDLSERQVLAAVGQSRLMQAYDRLFGARGITVAQPSCPAGTCGTGWDT